MNWSVYLSGKHATKCVTSNLCNENVVNTNVHTEFDRTCLSIYISVGANSIITPGCANFEFLKKNILLTLTIIVLIG